MLYEAQQQTLTCLPWTSAGVYSLLSAVLKTPARSCMFNILLLHPIYYLYTAPRLASQWQCVLNHAGAD